MNELFGKLLMPFRSGELSDKEAQKRFEATPQWQAAYKRNLDRVKEGGKITGFASYPFNKNETAAKALTYDELSDLRDEIEKKVKDEKKGAIQKQVGVVAPDQFPWRESSKDIERLHQEAIQGHLKRVGFKKLLLPSEPVVPGPGEEPLERGARRVLEVENEQQRRREQETFTEEDFFKHQAEALRNQSKEFGTQYGNKVQLPAGLQVRIPQPVEIRPPKADEQSPGGFSTRPQIEELGKSIDRLTAEQELRRRAIGHDVPPNLGALSRTLTGLGQLGMRRNQPPAGLPDRPNPLLPRPGSLRPEPFRPTPEQEAELRALSKTGDTQAYFRRLRELQGAAGGF